MRQIALSLSLAGLAFLMTAIWGGPLLRILRYFKIGKIIRVDEPGHHGIKMGTPTMGGVMFLLPVLLLSGLLNAVALLGVSESGTGRSVLLPMLVMIGFAILGAIDDWEGIRGTRKGEGMRPRTKFMFQVLLALGTAYILKYMMDVPDLYFPGLFFEIELGWLYVPIAAFIIVAESNAVNFTDGLNDGEPSSRPGGRSYRLLALPGVGRSVVHGAIGRRVMATSHHRGLEAAPTGWLHCRVSVGAPSTARSGD